MKQTNKQTNKKTFIVLLLTLIILIFIAFLFDIKIIKFIESIRNIPLDYLFLGITFASNTFITFFFLTALFIWNKHKRKYIFPLWITIFLSVAISYILKVLIKRPRPFQAGIVLIMQISNFVKHNFSAWNSSFPSFQAMLVFSALPLISKEFKKFKYVWFIFACFVAFSRMYLGVHYLSDVLTGAVVGYLIGYFILIIKEKIKKLKN